MDRMGASHQRNYMGQRDTARRGSAETAEKSIAIGLLVACRNGIVPKSIDFEAVVICYEIFLLALEKMEYAAEIARIGKMHPRDVRICSLKIVDLLLFNPRKDPFMSLGLPGNSSSDTVHRRWKRLMVMFHPDRPSARTLDVKRTKMINVAYQRIREILPANSSINAKTKRTEPYREMRPLSRERILSPLSQTFTEAMKIGRKHLKKAFYSINDLAGSMTIPRRVSYERDGTKYLKYIPSIIVLLTAFTAIIMLSLYIVHSLFSLPSRIILGE